MEGKVGAHASCTKDIPFNELINECASSGWTCCQVFLGSPQDCIHRRELTRKEKMIPKNFRVYSHFPYKMNLVKRRTKNEMAGLQYELDLMEEIDGYVVIHPNSPTVNTGPSNKESSTADEELYAIYTHQYQKAIDTMVKNIKLLANQHRLLLEPPAGEGQKIGWSLEQMTYICLRLTEEQLPVGFCIDTCHSFAAGVSKFRSRESVNKLFRNLSVAGVLPRLKSIHLNDSKTPYFSYKDSHALLTKGCIWTITKKQEGLEALVIYCRDNNIDIICETGGQHDVDVVMNITRR